MNVRWADGLDIDSWSPLVGSNTKMLYIETPTNPLTQLANISAFAELAHANNAQLVVDNCFCTPALQKPMELGADIVIHSATKYLDGQGRCVGGAVAGSAELIKSLTAFMRSAGPCMSPFNAWVFIKGLETLSMRMQRHSENASQLAQWLNTHPKISHVYYPGLDSHPDKALSERQQKMPGGILSIDIKGAREEAWRCIDAVKLCSITGNLGDARTTITHPATTTHGRISAEDREASGIGECLIRIAVGLEDVEDIQADLDYALAQV